MTSAWFTYELIVILIIITYTAYKFLTRNFDYWEKRNVPHPKPLPFFGNFFEVITFRTTINHYIAKLYFQFKTSYFGVFILNTPHLVVKSPHLIRDILVKDFNYFCDRIILSDETCDPLTSNVLFVVNNPNWKIIRSKLTPVFTSGKMKGMFDLINSVSLDMNSYISKHRNKDSIETKELFSKYATDVIASCAFGIQARSFEDENAEFRVIGRQMFDFEWGTASRQFPYLICHELTKFFKFGFFKPAVSDFFRNVFWKTVRLREEGSSKRNDLIDILIQMRKEHDDRMEFTGDRVVAQAVMFFGAGFETTSSTMAFTLYELCLLPEIQNKVRKEITEILLKYGGFTYEAIQDMKYLHMTICETLRKYPALPMLHRKCVKDYYVPGSDLVIEKDTPLYIPLIGLHQDPEIYPDPQKYDPERFSEENKKNIPSYSFLPFGEGPRNCIGERFALLFGKLGLARILSEYEVRRSSDTPIPLEFQAKSLFLASKVGLPMKFVNIASDDS